ncbi:hypothetical protein [Murimonas intestini]|uniref:Uncharacterized protein n=1 Tax=Murimonas intestini TaxID=1337051 RepID=A0AB73SZ81_9FIRM|nr:hypothetical protein [Murimonas intestini]MCR1842900.1 hypothetical protein [Murimonas intestini]MCR1868136.1 hypothetical protein [Murimonas intestini]MCR1885372.1 hypothetical protein [Murimonas intestini]
MNMTELKELGAICLERITDGFDKYSYESRYMGSLEAADEIGRLWEERGKTGVYADFYYYVLSDESREKVDEILTDREREYLRQIGAGGQTEKDDIIFPLDETLLSIVTKLNAAGMLFSTIYFTGAAGERSTWWGNYKEEYIIFSDKEKRV